MRNLLWTFAVLSVAAAPVMGTINVRLVPANATLDPNGVLFPATTTVALQFNLDTKAIGIVAGNITDSNKAAAAATGLTWIAQFANNATSPAQTGASDGNGGWAGFAGTQMVPNDTTLGLNQWSTVLTLSVGALAPGASEFTFVNVPVLNPATGQNRATSSLSLGGIPAKFDTTIGTITPCTINVVPEPVSLALLAIGGLVIARRRR